MSGDITWKEIVDAFFWKDSFPSKEQKDVIDAAEAGNRRILICGGERGGKSMVASYIAILRMEPELPNAGKVKRKEPERRYWLVGPTYMAARPEFQYIRDFFAELNMIDRESMPVTPTQPWSLVTKNGVSVETKTSSDTTRLASFSIHGAIMCEAGNQEEEVVLKLYGRLSETKGWLLIVGTLEAQYSWYAARLERWRGPNPEGGVSFSIPAWANLAIYPGGRNDPEIKLLEASVPPDWFNRRYAGIVAKPSNLVIPEFDFATHVRKLDFDRKIPIELAIDPGKNAYAVLFLQRIGAIVYVMDAVYGRGVLVNDIILKCLSSPFWPYINKEPATSVIDIAGAQQPGQESQVDIWRKSTGINLGFRYYRMKDTIDVVRSRLRTDPVLNMPLVLFSDGLKEGVAPDGTATEFLSEFSLWKWPQFKAGMPERAEPIDANNHGIKALGYYLQHHYGMERERKPVSYARVRPIGFAKAKSDARIHKRMSVSQRWEERV